MSSGGALQLRESLRHLRGRDYGGGRLDDAGLRARDFRDRVTKPSHVVERDGGEDRDLTVGDVRGIPLAAHAHLENDHVRRVRPRSSEREKCERLEEAERRLVTELELGIGDVEERADVLPVRHERRVTDGLAVDHDALVHTLQMRTGQHAGAQPVSAQDALDHPARGRLAVGSRDVDDRVRALRVAQEFCRTPGRFQSRLPRARLSGSSANQSRIGANRSV